MNMKIKCSQMRVSFKQNFIFEKMKEIQGKIKFGVIPMNKKEENNRFLVLDNDSYNSLSKDQLKNSYYLSLITEEQAAEFAEIDNKLDDEYFGDVYGFVNYFSSQNNWHPLSTAKESLISSLKANDVWIKEWLHDEYDVESYRQKLLSLPDDLLLIKL